MAGKQAAEAFTAWASANAAKIHTDAIDEAAMGFAAGWDASTDTELLEACREFVALIAEPPDAEELGWNEAQLRGLLGLFRHEGRSLRSKLTERLEAR